MTFTATTCWPQSDLHTRRRPSLLARVLGSLAMLAISAMSEGWAAELTLVDDGVPTSVVVLPVEADAAEQQAADELVEHIALISGAHLSVIRQGEPTRGLTPIRIGTAADSSLGAVIQKRGDDPAAFALLVDDASVQLRGLSPVGSRTAAYELLEQLGVRWYLPGETGRVVPKDRTVTLAKQQTVQAPSFEGRRGVPDPYGQWNDRLRMGGKGRYGAHGIHPFSGSARQAAFEANPEFFGLVDGQRRPRQLCLTNSTAKIEENQVLKQAVEHYRQVLRKNPGLKVLNMGPNDGGGYCECDHCRALDPPADHTTPLATPEPSFTDRYVWFFNHLTEALSDEFPGIRIGFYAYAQHLMPPVVAEARDNLAISLAPIHVCRIHGPNNPMCPESNFPLWAYDKWRPYAGEFMADRGYMYNLAEPGFPFSMLHRIREEIPAYYESGVRIWAADAARAWGSHNPSMYLVCKLLWDHTADVDAILEEFYELYYGPAAEPMAAYHVFMDTTVRDADHHTGSVWDIPFIYPPEVRRTARSHLEQAADLAKQGSDEVYATRVAIVSRTLDFLDAYCELRQRRDAFDFAGEKQAMEQAREIRDSLLKDFEYPMLHPRHAESYFQRFVDTPTTAIWDSLGEAEPRIVARLDHEWQFQLDPHRWGRYTGLHKAESKGGNWQTIRTDTSWSNQGLRYYFGQAWYRQTVEVPAEFEGETIHIWFAGVDNTAVVWVNGAFVGANHEGAEFDLDAYGSAFQPFQFDATEAIKFGERNVITVRAMRPGTKEVGTGGLVGPAMLYSPAP